MHILEGLDTGKASEANLNHKSEEAMSQATR
jgi:hypothetical protein